MPAAITAALVAIIALLLVLASTVPPGPPTGSSTPSPGSSAPATPPSTAVPSPSEMPAPSPTSSVDTCVLPDVLPPPDPSPTGAGPKVNEAEASIVFTSYLYARDESGALVVRDDVASDWAVGVWLVTPPQEDVAGAPVDVRLLASTELGMVIPIALSPQADMVVAWWLPARRAAVDTACQQGIYLIPADGSPASRLATGDWSLEGEADERATWTDGTTGGARGYALPEAGFSVDGRFLNIVDAAGAAVYDRSARQVARREGPCVSWSWSPVEPLFVAGCATMKTAWLVDAAAGTTSEVQIPEPPEALVSPAWEAPWAREIALTFKGKIDVLRFYGLVTGCEEPGCTLPPPAYAVTLIEPDTGAGSTTVREIDFTVNPSDETDLAVALVPGGGWAYASTETSGGRVIDLGSGAISRSSLLTAASGVAADGRLLFGRDIREQRGRVAIFALDAYGGATDFGSIAWPEGALTSYRVIPVINLIVALPPD